VPWRSRLAARRARVTHGDTRADARDGDAFILDIVDPDTGTIVADGERGCVYITTVHNYGTPQIRFNVNDVSAFCTEATPAAARCAGLPGSTGATTTW
jgi:phenylacetate-coenzyme A ligase PaaK-like adenylate-forming protein